MSDLNPWDFQATFKEPFVVWCSVLSIILAPICGALYGVASVNGAPQPPTFIKNQIRSWIPSFGILVSVLVFIYSIALLVYMTLFIAHWAIVPLGASLVFMNSTYKALNSEIKAVSHAHTSQARIYSEMRSELTQLERQITFLKSERKFLSSWISDEDIDLVKMSTLGLEEQWEHGRLTAEQLEDEFEFCRELTSTHSHNDSGLWDEDEHEYISLFETNFEPDVIIDNESEDSK